MSIRRSELSELPVAKLEQIVRQVTCVGHKVIGGYVYTDEGSGWTFWVVQCSEFSLTFSDKPGVRVANIWSVPLKMGMDWNEVADAILMFLEASGSGA